MNKNGKTILEMDYSNEPRRDILCIDIKSFFASVEAVELRQHPLKAMIAVVSKPDNNGGLVLAASPRVKKEYNVRTGTRVYEIPKHSAIQIVEPRMSLYLDKNLEIINIFKRYVSKEDLYIYSIDESFLDVTKSHALFGSTHDIATKIQRDIWQELKLIATVGIGDNPLLAKLALDHQAKNDYNSWYQAYWSYERVPETIWRIQDLTDFWGIGSRTEVKLNRLGIHNLHDLAHYDVHKMKDKFNVIGEQLFFHAHGIDRTILSDNFQPKENSFSKNQILNRDYIDPYDVEVVIREMTEENAMRLRERHFTTSNVKLTIGYSKDTVNSGFSHQMTIAATDSSKKLVAYMLRLFRKYYEPYPVRVVNVTFNKVAPKQGQQLSLFESVEDVLKDERLDETIDLVRKKYGYTSLLHASSLLRNGMAIQRSKLLGGHQANTNDTEK
jgi:DNA polymerase V